MRVTLAALCLCLPAWCAAAGASDAGSGDATAAAAPATTVTTAVTTSAPTPVPTSTTETTSAVTASRPVPEPAATAAPAATASPAVTTTRAVTTVTTQPARPALPLSVPPATPVAAPSTGAKPIGKTGSRAAGAADASSAAPTAATAAAPALRWNSGDAVMSSQAAQAAQRIVSDVTLDRDSEAPATRQLLSQRVLNKFLPALRRQIQQALLEIYSEDPAYLQAYREVTQPLSDNIVGPITLSWLNRFWFDFKMEPSGNLSDASVAALLHFAATVKAHPEWKADLVSADLGRWIDGFNGDDRARYYQIRLGGTDEQVLAMLRLYHYETDNNRRPGPDNDRALLTIYSYSLTAQDLALLAVKSQVIAKLSVLQDIVYVNQTLFDNAVLDALKDLGSEAQVYLPPARGAALSESYSMTLDATQALREAKSVPADILDALATLTATYPNQAAFSEAVLDATAGVSEPIDDYLPTILNAAETSTSYVLTARALAELKTSRSTEPVPPVILDMLKGLQGLEYPQQWLFDKAVLARLRQGVGACPSGTTGNAGQLRKIGADQMKQLAAAIKDPTLYAQLEHLWQENRCSMTDTLTMPQQIEALYIKYRASIRATARKKPAFDPRQRVTWSGNGCGCVLDGLAGDVYGVYPFWLAGQTQQVDFSTLTRIGYYGPTFDDTGVLRQANDGRDLVAAFEHGEVAQSDFVSVARRHQTAIDWVIQRNDWRSWARFDRNRKEQVLAALTDSIARLLTIRKQQWTTAISNVLPFGERLIETNGDGVTLFFDGYPEDDVSVDVFNRFVNALRQRLRQEHAGDSINLMMRHTALGQGIYDYEKLYTLITAAENARRSSFLAKVTRDPDPRPRLLVLLEEETTDAKKQLRLQIEGALHGEQRAKLLRQVVPVITFDHDNWLQLQDDIIYFKDNFGGVGFWTMPLTKATPAAKGLLPAKPLDAVLADTAGVQACDLTRSVSQCLLDYYQKDGNAGVEAPALCKTVCENLYAFRLATRLSFLLLAGGAVLYYFSCWWREQMKRYYYAPALALGALCFVLGMALLFCDPFLSWLANGYMIPLFLVLFIFALIWWYQYQLKERDEQP